MPTYDLLLLPGDGIGPEVMAEVKKLIAWMNAHGMGTFNTEDGLCGGCAYDAHGVAVTDEIVEKAKAADAVRLFKEGRRISHVAEQLGIGRASVYRALERAGLHS